MTYAAAFSENVFLCNCATAVLVFTLYVTTSIELTLKQSRKRNSATEVLNLSSVKGCLPIYKQQIYFEV